jgi:hypothetical protein
MPAEMMPMHLADAGDGKHESFARSHPAGRSVESHFREAWAPILFHDYRIGGRPRLQLLQPTSPT